MIATMVKQLMAGATPKELADAGLTGQYVQHDHALFPADANGVPFTSAYFQALGDWNADLMEDMAAEQKARATYEHIMDLTDDPDLLGPLSFLRQREVVHFNRFKELRDYYLEKYKNKDFVFIFYIGLIKHLSLKVLFNSFKFKLYLSPKNSL